MKQIWKGQNLTSIEVRSLRRTVAWTKLKKHEREESKAAALEGRSHKKQIWKLRSEASMDEGNCKKCEWKGA